MYSLEHDGYRNVTALRREFAIEVEDFDEKEKLIHTIFEKSQLSDTELFAIDVNIVKQLLSSFDGAVVFPKTETKSEVFSEATESRKSKLIPDGEYTLSMKNNSINATAKVIDGKWTLKRGSIIEPSDTAEKLPKRVKMCRDTLPVDKSGKLLEDIELGECAPSFVGSVVANIPLDGWHYWKDKDKQPINKYRQETEEE